MLIGLAGFGLVGYQRCSVSPSIDHRDFPAAVLGAFAFAQGVLQGLSSDDPVRFDTLPARYRGRLRLMPVQRLHHRDMRHHRIAAMLADKHQPARLSITGSGQDNRHLFLSKHLVNCVLDCDDRISLGFRLAHLNYFRLAQ